MNSKIRSCNSEKVKIFEETPAKTLHITIRGYVTLAARPMWLEIAANPSPKAAISNPSTARNAVSTERSTIAAVSGRVFLFLWLVSHSMPIYSRLKQILIHIEQYYFNENFINTDWFILDLDEKVIKVDQKSIELN